MIEFRNASFHYGGENGTGEGVDDLSLTIGEGEVVLFCGRSGCGKTTVTRMIKAVRLPQTALAPKRFQTVPHPYATCWTPP